MHTSKMSLRGLLLSPRHSEERGWIVTDPDRVLLQLCCMYTIYVVQSIAWKDAVVVLRNLTQCVAEASNKNNSEDSL